MTENKTFTKYKNGVVILFHTFLLLVFLNVALFGVFKIRDTYFKSNPVIAKYGIESLKRVYPDLTEEKIRKLLDDSWNRQMAYDSYTGFKEAPHRSAYVNVSEAGFRYVMDQGPWPINTEQVNIFVFGGSTTFGYGVSDSQTIPSYLQAYLHEKEKTNVNVYNFGHGRYFLGQERVLFEKMLAAGVVPDIAVFIDGLNEYHPWGEPDQSSSAQTILSGEVWPIFLAKLPLGRALTSLSQRLERKFNKEKFTINSPAEEDEAFNDPEIVDGIILNYLKNQQLTQTAAEKFGVKTIFVWQPVPLHSYDLNNHLFGAQAKSDKDTHVYSKYTYPALNYYLSSNPKEEDAQKFRIETRTAVTRLLKNSNTSKDSIFLRAEHLQNDTTEQLYVDAVHYSPFMSKRIAEFIGNNLIFFNYLPE